MSAPALSGPAAIARFFLDPGIEEPYRRGSWYILIERWYLTIAIFYLEIVFKLSTGSSSFFPSILVIALFSIAFGQAFYLLASFAPNPRINTIIKAVILGLLGLICCVEFFVYRQFGILYSVKTVLAGANDVAGGFMGTVFGLVFSFQGILHIVLFMLPLVLYILQARFPIDRARGISLPAKGRILASIVAAHLLAFVIISLPGSFGVAYGSQYSFQSAVPNYGLLTGIRKDLTTSSSVTFNVPEAQTTEEGGATETVKHDPQVKAVMDIDFDALAANADDAYAAIDRYVASLTPSSTNDMTGIFEGYNLIFLSAEAFSHTVLDKELTPTLYRLATKGIIFTDYYQFPSAGTTGGECQNIFGVLPVDGGESVMNTANSNNYFTMGNILNRLGYNGWAFHNNDYTYYDRHITHINLGYNNGFMGYGNGMEAYVKQQWPQSDLEMIQGTFDNLYGSQEPFNVYYMTVSGHSDYLYDESSIAQKNWDAVQGVEGSEPIKAYMANNLELEYAMEYLVGQLEEKGLADHTVIVLTADHYPYGMNESAVLGGEYLDELYGFDVQTAFERDKNALIIWSGTLEKSDPIVVREPVQSIDVLPTLCNMFGVEWDSRLLPGRDVFSETPALVFDDNYNWRTTEGTYENGEFIPNEDVQIENQSAYVEANNQAVANKLAYCSAILDMDYFGHVFGPAEDVQAVHDAAIDTGRTLHNEAVQRAASIASTSSSGASESSSTAPDGTEAAESEQEQAAT